MMWIRRCQECGNEQKDAVTPVYGETPSDAFCMRKCKKCKSEALDYGSERADDYVLNDPKESE